MTDTPNDTPAQIGPQPLTELVEAATAAKNELAAAGRYSEPVCTRLEAALKAFPAAWSEPDQIAPDAYLARFPADQRATADRAYSDGFADGGNGGFDLDAPDVATILAALRHYESSGQGDAGAIADLCERLDDQAAPARDNGQRLKCLIDGGLTFGEALNAFGEHQAANRPGVQPFIDALGDVVSGFRASDGDIDTDSIPIVSESDDGAYVLIWAWVSNEDAGIDTGETEPDEDED